MISWLENILLLIIASIIENQSDAMWEIPITIILSENITGPYHTYLMKTKSAEITVENVSPNG